MMSCIKHSGDERAWATVRATFVRAARLPLLHSSPMRRLLVLFFVMLLPLQFSWGAAASYCGHEQAPTTSHFGHHTHVHQGGHQNSGSAEFAAGANDLDCDYCHLGCAQPVASATSYTFLPLQTTESPREIAGNLSGFPSSIERPKWFSLVQPANTVEVAPI